MDKPNEHSPIGAAVGPGSTLRKARADLHLSAEDAAAQMHLAPRQVVALEADDYASLPQPTYVRGYLRSYALLLGLAPEPIIEAYNQATRGRKAPPPLVVHPDAEERAGQRDDFTKWVSAGITVLVLALVYAWWQGRETEPVIKEARVDSPTQREAVEQTPPALVSPAPPPIPLSPDLKVAAQPPASPAPSSVSPKPDPAPAVQAAQKNRVVPPVQPQVVAKPEPVVSTESAAQVATVSPEAPTAAGNQPAVEERRAKLVLQADVGSWVEVRDAHQTRLIYEAIPAGRVVGMEGVPPFQVFLGNVDGVKVFYEGQPFDAARFKRGTTARFSVGAAQAENP